MNNRYFKLLTELKKRRDTMTNFFIKIRWIFLALVFILPAYFARHGTSINLQEWFAYAAAVAVAILLFVFFDSKSNENIGGIN